MQKNKYDERKQQWLAADRRADELQPYTSRWRGYRSNTRWDDQYILWEPLEKPVFAGWDMWVSLTEAGMRRRDAPKILAVLKALGVDQPRFVRESRYIRIVRRAGHEYKRVEMAWTTRNGGYYWYPLQPLFNRKITEREYIALPGDLKPYFSKHTERSRWGGVETIEYHLDWHNQFPVYELTIKTQKAYNTYIGHLYGDEIGEYKKLRDWLWHESQAHVRKELGWDNTRYRDCFHRGIKTRWASACKELRNIPIHSLSETDGADEFEAYIERKYQLYNKKKYGYS